jgi:hypothetical protein
MVSKDLILLLHPIAAVIFVFPLLGNERYHCRYSVAIASYGTVGLVSNKDLTP